MVAGWDPTSTPLPPQNGMVTTPYVKGVLDIRWDNPALLARNGAHSVVGVNVYRSDASDRGPYSRINEFPVGGSFFRDRTDIIYIDREKVDWNTAWINQGDGANSKRFSFRACNPISKQDDMAPYREPTWANSASDVSVWVDGVPVEVHYVHGRAAEIILANQPMFDIITEKMISPPCPTEDTLVEVSYWTVKNHVPSGMEANLWYRLTTVALDPTTPSGYTETPLSKSKAVSLVEVESLDYIWREAVRRNQWILQQGGERVKVFVKKLAGIPCRCKYDERTLEFHKQPSASCSVCFGTGFRGGYEGPYDIIVAPDDAERRLSQMSQGRHMEHSYEVWTGPSPLLTQRDFIVKQTNERYSIGPVRRPSNRGNLLQQHANMAYLDEGDIRYDVPIDGTDQLAWPGSREAYIHMPRTAVDGGPTYEEVEGWEDGEGPYPEGEFTTTPMATDKANIENDREKRGRTKAWENQNY